MDGDSDEKTHNEKTIFRDNKNAARMNAFWLQNQKQ